MLLEGPEYGGESDQHRVSNESCASADGYLRQHRTSCLPDSLHCFPFLCCSRQNSRGTVGSAVCLILYNCVWVVAQVSFLTNRDSSIFWILRPASHVINMCWSCDQQMIGHVTSKCLVTSAFFSLAYTAGDCVSLLFWDYILVATMQWGWVHRRVVLP